MSFGAHGAVQCSRASTSMSKSLVASNLNVQSGIAFYTLLTVQKRASVRKMRPLFMAMRHRQARTGNQQHTPAPSGSVDALNLAMIFAQLQTG
jgi:hypothetical protein